MWCTTIIRWQSLKSMLYQIEVMAYIAPAERARLQALAEAGADFAVMVLSSAPEDAALAELEQLAQKVL